MLFLGIFLTALVIICVKGNWKSALKIVILFIISLLVMNFLLSLFGFKTGTGLNETLNWLYWVIWDLCLVIYSFSLVLGRIC